MTERVNGSFDVSRRHTALLESALKRRGRAVSGHTEFDFEHVRRQQVSDLETGRAGFARTQMSSTTSAPLWSPAPAGSCIRSDNSSRSIAGAADDLLHQGRMIGIQALRGTEVFGSPCGIAPCKIVCDRMARTSGHRRSIALRQAATVQSHGQTLRQLAALRQPLAGGIPLRLPQLLEALVTALPIGVLAANVTSARLPTAPRRPAPHGWEPRPPPMQPPGTPAGLASNPGAP